MRSSSGNPRKPGWWRAVPILLACAVGLPAAAATPALHVVKDPYYGDGLFYFYQRHYFTAMTDLMVSQHFDRLKHHSAEAELLRGGLYLSYGLHREAGDIFAHLIDRGAPPDVRDRAWYYLAKIRYQRDMPAEAEEALARIGDQLPPEFREDRVLMQANLLMARGAYADAAKTLKSFADNSKAGVYVRYNLGVALIKSGQFEQGTALLDEIGQAPAESEEMLSLRDKADVALGFAALQHDQPERARTYLERVRLSGMMASKALLGFGWASAALKQPREALVPWLELARRDTSDAAVLEAKLAVPYAMGELGAYAQSLELYTGAIGVFDQERANLDESIAAIRTGQVIDDLVRLNPGDEMGWFGSIERLPRMPHAQRLAPVLAKHEFQEAFKNYRDLLFLSKNLEQWKDRLDIYSDMLANRNQAFNERLPKIRAEEAAIGLDRMEQRRDQLTRELDWAEARSNVYAFTDPNEQKLAERLLRVRTILEQHGDDPQLAPLRERYRRVAGALTWQLTQEYPARSWDARKRLKELDAEVGEARSADAALAQAQRDEPVRLQQFAARIALLDWRIRTLQPRLAELIQDQRSYVQDLAVAELQHQKQQLATYATQARFAVARIYDRANLGKAGEPAPDQAAPKDAAPSEPAPNEAAPKAPAPNEPAPNEAGQPR